MRVFVTGATGWVGSVVVEELQAAGHIVVGLARSDAAAAALEKVGVFAHRGSLEDLDSLNAGATGADAVINAAFNHDFSRFAENAGVEKRAIEALGAALAGTGRPLIVTSGLALIAPGRIVTEDDVRDPENAVPFPRDPEASAFAAAERGVRVSVIRLPPSVHGSGETHGFVPITIGLAREHGRSAYVGAGANRWPGVHRRDAARLYRLVLERSAERAVYHAVADQGVPFRTIAEIIGRRLDLPTVSIAGDDVGVHFGWFANFAQIDAAASSAVTRQTLGWHPSEPTLLEDVDSAAYFPV